MTSFEQKSKAIFPALFSLKSLFLWAKMDLKADLFFSLNRLFYAIKSAAKDNFVANKGRNLFIIN
jgi:hypothetical protein